MEEVDESGRETIRIIREQSSIEWEVRKYYFDLYSEKDTKLDKEEILQNTDVLTKIDAEDVRRFDGEITEGEVSSTLKNTKNNVAPGPGGFGGPFHKAFL